jgi:hypothetical protein
MVHGHPDRSHSGRILPAISCDGRRPDNCSAQTPAGSWHVPFLPDDTYRDKIDFSGSFPIAVNREKFPPSFPLVCQRYANPFVPNGEWYTLTVENTGRRSTGFLRDTNNSFTRSQQFNGWKKIIDTAAKRGLKVLVGGPLYREFCLDAGSTVELRNARVGGTFTDSWPDDASVGGVDHQLDEESFRAFLDMMTAGKNFRTTVRGWYLADEPESHCDKTEYDRMYTLIKSHPRAKTKPVYVALPPLSYYDSTNGVGKVYNYDGRNARDLASNKAYSDLNARPWKNMSGSKNSNYLYRHRYREYVDWAPMASRDNLPVDSTASDVILLELYPYGNSTVSLGDWTRAISNGVGLSNIPPENLAAIVQGIVGEQPESAALNRERSDEIPDGDTVWTFQGRFHSGRHDRRTLSAGQIEKQIEFVHRLGVSEFYIYAWNAPTVWSEGGAENGLVVRTGDARHNWNRKGRREDRLGRIVKRWSSRK